MPLQKMGAFSFNHTEAPDDLNSIYTATEIKEKWDSRANELRTTINTVIDALSSTVDGDSGANGVKATTINGLEGTDLQTLIESLKSFVDAHKANTNNPHLVTPAQLNVYTKGELDPFLRGGDTVIKEEVFTIINSNLGDGTFTYSDKNNITKTGSITAEGYQVFTLQSGTYEIAQNRIEAMINDALHRSVGSGGLQEIDATHIALTVPEGNGAEITFKYFEKIGVVGTGLLVESDTKPAGYFWLKVVG
jgi:hypothetical protein